MSSRGARRDARRAALIALYQADLTGSDPADSLAAASDAEDQRPDPFAVELVGGVASSLSELDEVIGEHAEEWSVERMAPVDRAILRVATYELLHREDVPVAAVINEAVEAAKTLSTAASGGFVNGILGRIAREVVPVDRR